MIYDSKKRIFFAAIIDRNGTIVVFALKRKFYSWAVNVID
jgi:hypothetical protein